MASSSRVANWLKGDADCSGSLPRLAGRGVVVVDRARAAHAALSLEELHEQF